MQRKPASRIGWITFRHRNDQVGSPWMNTTGGPLPSSMWASRSPSNFRYFGLNGKSGTFDEEFVGGADDASGTMS